MNAGLMSLTEQQYNHISSILNHASGIVLKGNRQTLVKSRLAKRLRALKFESFDQYIDYINSVRGANEIIRLVDAMTTNKTGFFREPSHFDYLSNKILPQLKSRKIRFWSAACSSGEEPYSLAILLNEQIKDIEKKDVKILATDISCSMLKKASDAIYHKEHLAGLSAEYVSKYFKKICSVPKYQLMDSARAMVYVSFLNLMAKWPMRGAFDVIFCRNVMIYFDVKTREKLIERFWNCLSANGFLFVGSSEGLSGVKHKFKYIKPSIYKK